MTNWDHFKLTNDGWKYFPPEETKPESSPTPQVQSGLSAEDVLKQHIPVIFEAMKGLVVPAMEEYAASKVAERNQEIDRLNIEKRTLNGLNTQYLNLVAEKEREIEKLKALLEQSHSHNNSVTEANNIQQPDKI